MNIKKNIGLIIKLTAAAAALALAFSAASFAGACEDIEDRVLRLHILANSDSEADQALKLKVRDAILEISPELFGDISSKQEAMAKAEENLSKIAAEAQQAVNKEGCGYTVTAELVSDKFNTRVYENFTLPAGEYDAVRITIGSGEGHNWWCVMFPALCLPSAEKSGFEDFPEGESEIIAEGESGYEIRFGIVEAVSDFSSWLCGLF